MFVSTKKRSAAAFIRLFPRQPVRRQTGNGNRLDALPLLVRRPVLLCLAHLVFQHASDQFGDRRILFGGLLARPPERVFLDRDGNVLQHELSVTRTSCCWPAGRDRPSSFVACWEGPAAREIP